MIASDGIASASLIPTEMCLPCGQRERSSLARAYAVKWHDKKEGLSTDQFQSLLTQGHSD